MSKIDYREDDPLFVKQWLKLGASRELIEQTAARIFNEGFMDSEGKKPVTERISRDRMLMAFASAAAQRSTCLRKQVGAVIAIDGRPLSIGYAGAAPGFPHCTPQTCNAEKPCTNTIHAEANAIAWAARNGIAVKDATLYCTLSPCESCAKLILAAGIGRVVFLEQYRDVGPLSLLLEGGIKVLGYYKLVEDFKAFYGDTKP